MKSGLNQSLRFTTLCVLALARAMQFSHIPDFMMDVQVGRGSGWTNKIFALVVVSSAVPAVVGLGWESTDLGNRSTPG